MKVPLQRVSLLVMRKFAGKVNELFPLKYRYANQYLDEYITVISVLSIAAGITRNILKSIGRKS